MTKRFILTAGIFGLLSVLLGAVGYHIIEGNIPQSDMSMYNLANDFIFYHTLVLLAFAAMKSQLSRSYLNTIYYFFVIGVALFSGSILVQSLNELTGFNSSFLSKLSVVGGILITLGWITIVLLGLTYKHKYKIRHQERQ